MIRKEAHKYKLQVKEEKGRPEASSCRSIMKETLKSFGKLIAVPEHRHKEELKVEVRTVQHYMYA